MQADPVAKFFALKGAAAAALAELERIGKRRCRLQDELSALERKSREWRVGSDVVDKIAILRSEISHLQGQETALLGEYERAATFEGRLRDTLKTRGML